VCFPGIFQVLLRHAQTSSSNGALDDNYLGKLNGTCHFICPPCTAPPFAKSLRANTAPHILLGTRIVAVLGVLINESSTYFRARIPEPISRVIIIGLCCRMTTTVEKVQRANWGNDLFACTRFTNFRPPKLLPFKAKVSSGWVRNVQYLCYSHPEAREACFRICWSALSPKPPHEAWRQHLAMEMTAKIRPALEVNPYFVAVNIVRFPQSGFLPQLVLVWRLTTCLYRSTKGPGIKSSPVSSFLFVSCTVFQRALARWLPSSLKLARLSVPYGLSLWVRHSRVARPNIYTAHLSSFAIPKTRAVPHLILVHRGCQPTASLVLRYRG